MIACKSGHFASTRPPFHFFTVWINFSLYWNFRNNQYLPVPLKLLLLFLTISSNTSLLSWFMLFSSSSIFDYETSLWRFPLRMCSSNILVLSSHAMPFQLVLHSRGDRSDRTEPFLCSALNLPMIQRDLGKSVDQAEMYGSLLRDVTTIFLVNVQYLSVGLC